MDPENDLRIALAAFKAAHPQSTPGVKLRVAKDGELLLFLHDEGKAVVGEYASGQGKTLPEAAQALRLHLVKMLQMSSASVKEKLQGITKFMETQDGQLQDGIKLASGNDYSTI